MVMKSIGHHGFQSEAIGSMPGPVQGAAAGPSSCRKKKYKGVRMRSWGSWVSEIRAPNQKTRIWLGSYSTAEAAARAYDAALICLKGASAATNLNFPITSPSIQIPDNASNMSPKSIQRFAAAAAAGAPPTKYAAEMSSSSSLFMSSPQAMTSPPSDQYEDDAMMLMPTTSDADVDAAAAAAASSWYEYDGFDIGLQSPKYADFMFNGFGYFNVPAAEEFFEPEGEIGLWSFG